jgi:hypothetical protein
MRLGEALDALRSLPAPSVGDAQHLLGDLDPRDLRLVRHPRRECKGTHCPFTTKDWWYGGGKCKCAPTALALRLLSLARSDYGMAKDTTLVLWHKLECSACGSPFKDRRETARYCPRCTGDLPSLRKQSKRKRGK